MIGENVSRWEELSITSDNNVVLAINSHTATYYNGHIHLYGGLGSDPNSMFDIRAGLYLH